MAMERAPKNPLPKDYAPSKSWYKVTDHDDWGTIAKKFEFDVHTLIYFNFHTHNPDEVNWYLRRNVGCKVSRDGGRNLAFSDSAYPGKIYLPAGQEDFDDALAIKKEDPGGRNDLAKMLEDMPEESDAWEHVGRTLELFEFAHITAEVFEVGVATEAVAGGESVVAGGSETVVATGATGGVGLTVAVTAPVAGMVAVLLALGSPYKAQVDLYKKRAWLWGAGQGVVLGANKNVNIEWVKTHFIRNMPNYIKFLINIPGQENQFGEVAKSYVDGLGRGFKYGRDLNAKETARLYKVLKEEVNPSTIDHVGSVQYYFQYGTEFRAKFLPGA